MDIGTAKHAFVTGGASGIGLAIARSLADRGVRVTIADVDADGMAEIVAERPDAFRAQLLDTRDRDGWVRAKAEAEAAFGPVDILVNNAGVGPSGQQFADMDFAAFDRIVGINLIGVFNGVATFAADLRARGRGHIVNVSSTAGLTFSPPGAGAYTVAKHGVVAMSETMRGELEPHGVGVSVLCPGLVDTNLPRTTARLSGDLRGVDARMPQGAADPALVGELVVRAIEENRAYILTHPQRWPDTEARLRTIEEAFRTASAM